LYRLWKCNARREQEKNSAGRALGMSTKWLCHFVELREMIALARNLPARPAKPGDTITLGGIAIPPNLPGLALSSVCVREGLLDQ
jgi:hypothetical protein